VDFGSRDTNIMPIFIFTFMSRNECRVLHCGLGIEAFPSTSAEFPNFGISVELSNIKATSVAFVVGPRVNSVLNTFTQLLSFLVAVNHFKEVRG
jgi:hypothetical protein